MIQTVKRFVSYSISQIVALVAAMITVLITASNTYGPPYKACLAAQDCLPTLAANFTLANIAWHLSLLICYALLIVLNIWALSRAFSQAKRDPVGFFYARVSSLKQVEGQKQVEYNLAEVRRTENGRLEYRGVSRASESDDLDFCWRARDAWVHPTSQAHRFIFRTEPGDIYERPKDMPPDTANIGFVDMKFRETESLLVMERFLISQ